MGADAVRPGRRRVLLPGEMERGGVYKADGVLSNMLGVIIVGRESGRGSHARSRCKQDDGRWRWDGARRWRAGRGIVQTAGCVQAPGDVRQERRVGAGGPSQPQPSARAARAACSGGGEGAERQGTRQTTVQHRAMPAVAITAVAACAGRAT